METAVTWARCLATYQASGEMLELRQLNLQLTLVAFGTLREDIEDQAGTIYDAMPEVPLQIALLGRR